MVSRTAPPGSTSTTRSSPRARCAPRRDTSPCAARDLCIGRDGGDTVTRGRRLRHYQRARPPHLVAALATWALVVPQAIAHAHPGPACWATRCSAARGG